MINSNEIASKISENFPENSKSNSKKIVEFLVSKISEGIKNNERVNVLGLGIFSVKTSRERQGINPQTKEKITIPSRQIVKFKVSSTLKKSVQLD